MEICRAREVGTGLLCLIMCAVESGPIGLVGQFCLYDADISLCSRRLRQRIDQCYMHELELVVVQVGDRGKVNCVKQDCGLHALRVQYLPPDTMVVCTVAADEDDV